MDSPALDACPDLGVRRWLSVGSSRDADPRRAGAAAAAGALTGDAPLAGFYTWGEIARTRGINGFHHQTLVVLAVA